MPNLLAQIHCTLHMFYLVVAVISEGLVALVTPDQLGYLLCQSRLTPERDIGGSYLLELLHFDLRQKQLGV